jgi:hypothetical protein
MSNPNGTPLPDVGQGSPDTNSPEFNVQQLKQRLASFRLRLAIIEALEVGVYRSEIDDMLKDVLFGVQRFGLDDAKAYEQSAIASVEAHLEDAASTEGGGAS